MARLCGRNQYRAQITVTPGDPTKFRQDTPYNFKGVTEHKFMANTSLHGKQMGKQWKQWLTLFSWAPKSLQMVITAMKLRHLLLGRKVMNSLDIILKSTDIALPTKVHLVKAMVIPVVMYGCESWTVKKAER